MFWEEKIKYVRKYFNFVFDKLKLIFFLNVVALHFYPNQVVKVVLMANV